MRPYFARTNLRDLKAKCTPREFNFPNYRHCLILQTLSDIKIETQKQKCKFYCISVNFKFLRLFLRKLIFAIFFFNRSPCFCCLDEYIFINDKYVYAAIPRQLLVFSAGNSGGTRYQNYCPLYNQTAGAIPKRVLKKIADLQVLVFMVATTDQYLSQDCLRFMGLYSNYRKYLTLCDQIVFPIYTLFVSPRASEVEASKEAVIICVRNPN